MNIRWNRTNLVNALVLSVFAMAIDLCTRLAPRYPLACGVVGVGLITFAAVMHLPISTFGFVPLGTPAEPATSEPSPESPAP